MDPAGIIIFLVVMSLLQGLGKLVEWLANLQKKAQEQQEAEQAAGAPPPERRTPFDALVRYMEDHARGSQPEVAPPLPTPTPPPPVYVSPPPTSMSLSQRHIHSAVADRHSGTGVGDRHMGGLGGRTQLTGFRAAARADMGSLEAIEALPILQKAIIYSELLGPPRSQEAWRAKKL